MDSRATDRDEWALNRLLEAAANLASNADDQEGHLRRLGVDDADELALDFDDISAAAIHTLLEIDNSQGARLRLQELDQVLDAMSGPEHAELWTFRALHENAEWNVIRKLAADLIANITELEQSR